MADDYTYIGKDLPRHELDWRYAAEIKNAAHCCLHLTFYDTEIGLFAQLNGWRPALFQGPASCLSWFFAGWAVATEKWLASAEEATS